jgi:CDP-glycerol glycerophosphotransferase (TagB/SpsB family)
MSAASYARDAVAALRDMLYGLCGWTLLAPLAAMVPKRRDWIAVIGRAEGKFLDNTKYFFIDASLQGPPGLRVVHVTGSREVHAQISAAGLQSLRFPSLAAWWFLARCGTAVVDSIEWCERGRCFLLCRARIVQLWHGVGFKRIELDKWRNEARGRKLVASPWLFWLRMLRKRLRGRLPLYDAVVTTSAFYRDNVFRQAFRSRHVLTCGYPRNGFGQSAGKAAELAWLNVDPAAAKNIRPWHAQGRKVVLVAPTFRDTRATPLGLDETRQALLDQFCAEHGYEFLFKFHPYEHGATRIKGTHLHVLGAHSDAYPLFSFLHAMVTDYSSIYMDFLLTDRPIFFLAPDLDDYVTKDRDIQFDFEKMTPGPKLDDWPALLAALQDANDSWKPHREMLRRLVFDDDPQSQATARILDFMLKHHWLNMDNAEQRVPC